LSKQPSSRELRFEEVNNLYPNNCQITPMHSKNTEVTRYLCAAAHLDSEFCDEVIKQIVESDYKAIGVSPGVDSFIVFKHCLAAKSRRKVRDVLLAILLLLSILLTTITHNLGHYFEGQALTSKIGSFIGILIYSFFSPSFLLACTIVFLEAWISRYKIVAKFLLKENYNPNFVKIKSNLHLKNRLKELATHQKSNVVIYGGLSPFVGSGFYSGGWSFALDINKGKEEMGQMAKPLHFQVKELYDYVAKALENLKLKGLIIEDKLYVNGQEIKNDIRFLSHPLARPYSQVDTSIITEFVEKQTSTVRYYKSLKIVTWKGELILSIFLRFVKLNHNLFIEVTYLLLPPLKEEYYEVDSLSANPSLFEILVLIWKSVMRTLFLWPFSPIILFLEIVILLKRWNENLRGKRLIQGNSTFNYGATTNIRELATSSKYRKYFQKLDNEMHLKIIERQILDRIIDFLNSRNIDTTDLKERETTILNNGVIVSGGYVEAQNLSVGTQAKSVLTSFPKTVMSETSKGG
jgi:hypothetical protein